MKTMKICLVGLNNLPVLASEFKQYRIGGESVQQSLLAMALARRGYLMKMVVGDYGQPDGAIWSNVTTYKAYRFDSGIPGLRFFYPRWIGMWEALKRADADVYYTSCAGMHVGLIAMFCKRYRRGFVFRLASDSDADPNKLLIKYWRDKKLYQYGLRRADIVLAQTAHQKELLRRNFGVKSLITDMLVETPKQNLGLNERDVDILWVNNIRSLKRPFLALELAKLLPHRSVHVVGGALPGFQTLYQDVKTQAYQLKNIIFHGQIPYLDVGNLYDRALVFINTSDLEGFPNSYLQSWSRGVPVVSFFDPDDVIRREGLGTAVVNLDEMSRAVEGLIRDDIEWKKRSKNCRYYIEKKHGHDIVLKPYIKAFNFADCKRR